MACQIRSTDNIYGLFGSRFPKPAYNKYPSPLNLVGNIVRQLPCFFVVDMLVRRAFDVLKKELTKHDLRELMRKWSFSPDDVKELETKYHGKDQLEERINQALELWRSRTMEADRPAGMDQIVHLLHILDMEALSQKIYAIKVYSQALRL